MTHGAPKAKRAQVCVAQKNKHAQAHTRACTHGSDGQPWFLAAQAYTGKLRVRVLRATNLKKGDMLSQSDGYVVLKLNDEKYQTKTIKVHCLSHLQPLSRNANDQMGKGPTTLDAARSY